MTDGQVLIMGFALAALVEMYFFLMQRVPLEVAREQGIPSEARGFMLPTWYGLVWVAKIAKWILVFLIWRTFGWWQALLCVTIPFILSSFLPVPYTRIADIIERRLRREESRANGELAQELLVALQESRSKHGF